VDGLLAYTERLGHLRPCPTVCDRAIDSCELQPIGHPTQRDDRCKCGLWFVRSSVLGNNAHGLSERVGKPPEIRPCK
jgi:hypothetical protein